jgi:HNH endonuclease
VTSYQRRLLRHPAFANYVDTSAGVHGCWPWLRCRVAKGYGRVRFGGKTWWAHRLARFVAYGDLPAAVCHHCDNPPCLNPEHLWAGTLAENTSDMWRKGRAASPVVIAKLDLDSVATIRSIAPPRDVTRGRRAALRRLAVFYGVSLRTIYRVLNDDELPVVYRSVLTAEAA